MKRWQFAISKLKLESLLHCFEAALSNDLKFYSFVFYIQDELGVWLRCRVLPSIMSSSVSPQIHTTVKIDNYI